MILAVLLQIGVLFYNSLQYKDLFKRNRVYSFLRNSDVHQYFIDEIFPSLSNRTSDVYSVTLPAAFVPLVLNFFLNRRRVSWSRCSKQFQRYSFLQFDRYEFLDCDFGFVPICRLFSSDFKTATYFRTMVPSNHVGRCLSVIDGCRFEWFIKA